MTQTNENKPTARRAAADAAVGTLRTQQDADRSAQEEGAALLWNSRGGYLIAGVQMEIGTIGNTGRSNIRRIEMRLPPGLSFQSAELCGACLETDGFKRRVSLGQVDLVDTFSGMRASRAIEAVRETVDRPTLRRLLAVEQRDNVASAITAQLDALDGGDASVRTRSTQRAHTRT